jgi:diguanylate cyclase (GGDEF)-like protein
MPDPSPAFLAQLKALREAFLRDIPARVAEIEGAWNDASGPDEIRLGQVQQLAHRLGGAGGTFGFHALGEAARDLELTARAASADGGGMPAALRAVLQGQLQKLRLAAQEATPPPPEPPPQDSPRVGAAAAPRTSELFLLYPGPHPADWAAQLATFGFPCRTFHSLESFLQGLREGTPPVAILDDESLPGSPSTPGPLLEFQTARSVPVPLIMLSNWPDLESRIRAVRAGCRAYLPKPPDLLALVEAVEVHSHEGAPDPLRVLVVEDDPHQSRHHAAVLTAAGIEVVEVNDPLKVMPPLVEGRPDLVLMDIYMPGCTGVELATAIRQQEAFVGIPIVFLSQERLRSFQLEAMRHGGDDFLTKPVDPEHLVSIVTTRGHRGRILRSHMVRDSLTGLLNHSSILDRLSTELARAGRSREPLSFAMLDLDYFKAVNDTYGHAAGDRVLRSFARMLQQRLRKTDLVGRYGGEEFAIILPGAAAVRAATLLDDIRESFSLLEFTFGEAHTRLTFSAGVAEFPAHISPERLAGAADEALYRAKRSGRNRVIAP